MNVIKKIEKAKALIGNANLAQALTALSDLSHSCAGIDQEVLTLLMNRAIMWKKSLNGEKSHSIETIIEFNKISNSIIDLIFSIELENHLNSLKKESVEKYKVSNDLDQEILAKYKSEIPEQKEIDKAALYSLEERYADFLNKKLIARTTENKEEPSKKKILMLGTSGVGKRSLSKSTPSAFSESYLETIGVKVEKKSIYIDGKEIELMLWVLAGDREIHNIPQSYLIGTSAAFIVLDISQSISLEDFEKLHEDIQQLLPKIPTVLLFNKSDLVETIDISLMSFLASKGHKVITTSAMTGGSVSDAFYCLTKEILKHEAKNKELTKIEIKGKLKELQKRIVRREKS